MSAVASKSIMLLRQTVAREERAHTQHIKLVRKSNTSKEETYAENEMEINLFLTFAAVSRVRSPFCAPL